MTLLLKLHLQEFLLATKVRCSLSPEVVWWVHPLSFFILNVRLMTLSSQWIFLRFDIKVYSFDPGDPFPISTWRPLWKKNGGRVPSLSSDCRFGYALKLLSSKLWVNIWDSAINHLSVLDFDSPWGHEITALSISFIFKLNVSIKLIWAGERSSDADVRLINCVSDLAIQGQLDS